MSRFKGEERLTDKAIIFPRWDPMTISIFMTTAYWRKPRACPGAAPDLILSKRLWGQNCIPSPGFPGAVQRRQNQWAFVSSVPQLDDLPLRLRAAPDRRHLRSH